MIAPDSWEPPEDRRQEDFLHAFASVARVSLDITASVWVIYAAAVGYTEEEIADKELGGRETGESEGRRYMARLNQMAHRAAYPKGRFDTV